MKGRIAVGIMSLLLLLYLVVVVQLAFRLLAVDVVVSKLIGVALLVLPLLGAWALVAELLFGIRCERLIGVLRSSGGLPSDSLPTRASGRPERAAADAAFPRYQAAVESAPGSWQAWFRLGLAYDACGDRRRGRRSIGHAIRLERAERKAA
ncbi:hypothetical protein [Parafrigoribacterium humi]|jgi:hypothetical protein|uniref:hypothetical protein n=1 Tax=Parafrigoribacterium humi TaxID=3144664 RepID=UPI0032EBCED4